MILTKTFEIPFTLYVVAVFFTLSMTKIKIFSVADETIEIGSNFHNLTISSIKYNVDNEKSYSEQRIVDKSTVQLFENTNIENNNKMRYYDSEKFNDSKRKLRRGKRYLDFVKGTRISWRTTVKNNILKINTLWGYGFGFRSNFPFPDKADRLRPFFKRDLLHSTMDMLDGHGLDGRACLLKSYCTAQLDGESSIGGGMIFKLLKMLLSLNNKEKQQFPFLNLENCHQILHSHCPLSFNSISPYTDDV